MHQKGLGGFLQRLDRLRLPAEDVRARRRHGDADFAHLEQHCVSAALVSIVVCACDLSNVPGGKREASIAAARSISETDGSRAVLLCRACTAVLSLLGSALDKKMNQRTVPIPNFRILSIPRT